LLAKKITRYNPVKKEWSLCQSQGWLHSRMAWGKAMIALSWVPGWRKKFSRYRSPRSPPEHGFQHVFSWVWLLLTIVVPYTRWVGWPPPKNWNIASLNPFKDNVYRDIFEVMKYCCCVSDRFWRTIYNCGLWIPRDVALELVSDGWDFTAAHCFAK
jgi:hypothetical protein